MKNKYFDKSPDETIKMESPELKVEVVEEKKEEPVAEQPTPKPAPKAKVAGVGNLRIRSTASAVDNHNVLFEIAMGTEVIVLGDKVDEFVKVAVKNPTSGEVVQGFAMLKYLKMV